jgi:uncharacterized protein YhfF/ribosomal protein S18 acetylase RimI-like enzyme
VADAAAESPDNTVEKSPAVAAYWTRYCRAAALPESTPYQAWYFGDSASMSRELADLVVHGPKRATAGAAWVNELAPHAAPVPDGYSVVTEADGTPRAVIRTVWLDTRPLAEVDAQFAWDEGEGDRSLPDWLDGHRRFFARECARAGRPFDERMRIALERFELLYPFDRALAPPDGPRVVPAYLPGAIGAVAALQAGYYAREHGFGAFFEAKVAREFAAFVARFDPAADGLWLLVDGGAIHGSIVIDGHDMPGAAHLRWLIVGDGLRGTGAGRRLLDAALAFCARSGHRRIFLDTFAGLDAARSLYERAGFRLVAERAGETWGRAVHEQRFEKEI